MNDEIKPPRFIPVDEMEVPLYAVREMKAIAATQKVRYAEAAILEGFFRFDAVAKTFAKRVCGEKQ